MRTGKTALLPVKILSGDRISDSVVTDLMELEIPSVLPEGEQNPAGGNRHPRTKASGGGAAGIQTACHPDNSSSRGPDDPDYHLSYKTQKKKTRPGSVSLGKSPGAT